MGREHLVVEALKGMLLHFADVSAVCLLIAEGSHSSFMEHATRST